MHKEKGSSSIARFVNLGLMFITVVSLLRGSIRTGCVDTPGLTFRELEKEGKILFGPGMYNLADRPQDLPGEIEGWTGTVYNYNETMGIKCYGNQPVKIKLYKPK